MINNNIDFKSEDFLKLGNLLFEEKGSPIKPPNFNLQESFRDKINHHLLNNIDKLPYIKKLNGIESIDSQTIIELNNHISSERRLEIMNSIINHENNSENLLSLIENSSPHVRTYINDLLRRTAINSNITEEDFYRIGNIFLYTISNLEIEGLLVRDFMKKISETMCIYNINQISIDLDKQITTFNKYLEEIKLKNSQELEEITNNFIQGIEERAETFQKEREEHAKKLKKKILIGGGIICLGLLGVDTTLPNLIIKTINYGNQK